MQRGWVEKFLHLSADDHGLLVRTVLLLGAARLAVWLLPLGTARRLLTRAAGRDESGIGQERIGWAVGAARRVVPWANCLPQALAAEALLARGGHPAELRIGVIKTGHGSLKAHAWVESGGRIVVGQLHEGLSQYTPLPPLPGPWS